MHTIRLAEFRNRSKQDESARHAAETAHGPLASEAAEAMLDGAWPAAEVSRPPSACSTEPRNPRRFGTIEGGVLALLWGAVVSFSAVAGFPLVLCPGHMD